MSAGAHDERDRNGRQAEEAAFDGGSNRAGIQHVVTQVGAVVDPRHHHVVLDLAFEQARDREMDAVRGRAVHEVPALAVLGHAQGYVEGERVAGSAAIALGSDHGDLGKRLQRVDEALQALGAIAIVVADQDSHVAWDRVVIWAPAAAGLATNAAQLYWNPGPPRKRTRPRCRSTNPRPATTTRRPSAVPWRTSVRSQRRPPLPSGHAPRR